MSIDQTKLKTHHFQGAKGTGVKLLITGRIHGNEPCGEIAINRIITEINNGDLTLKQGGLTLIPCCNPRASEQNIRYIDANLNRIMSTHLVEQYIEAYEANLAPQVMNAIDQCDAFVDLHSFTESEMPPLVICIDQDEIAKAMARNCGIKRIECDSPHLTKPGAKMTTHYARHKNKPAIIIECGQHNSKQSIEVAYQSIINLLVHFNMIEGQQTKCDNHEFLVIRSALYHEKGQTLLFPLMDRQDIKVGEPLYKTEHGDVIHSHESGLLLMRNDKTPEGEEYAYICDVYDDWP